MKKLPISLLLLSAIAVSGSAQSKFDFGAARLLNSISFESPRLRAQAMSKSVTALVTLADDADISQLEAVGASVFDVIAGVAIVDIDLSSVEALAQLDCVKNISFGDMAQPLMDKARVASVVDPVQAGQDLDMPYTGKGVITSLFDTGLDPNHINFLTDAGQSRVKSIAVVSGTAGTMTAYTTADEIAGFTTENREETHGTHVLGIMAGSYNGRSEYAGSVAKTSGNMPYYGVATGSDIVVTCGDLYNNNILKGVKYAIDQAEAAGQPVVVNLSLGSNYGPHDGSSAFSRTLAAYGEKAVIVVAAGNEGDVPMAISKNCSKLSRVVRTFLEPTDPTSSFNGIVEFYASDNQAFKFSIVIYDGVSKKIISQYDLNESTANRPVNIGGSDRGDMIQLDGFDEAYSSKSYLSVSSNVDTNNNRYGVSVSHYLDASRSSNYYLGFVIEGIAGQMINGYANTTNSSVTGVDSKFTSRGISGWNDGSTNGSISDMACGDNIIAIGSYNTRNSWRTLGGSTYSYNGSGYTVGEISGFSSYGTTFNGRQLPDLCAPGAGIISSYSTFYVSAAKVDPLTLCGTQPSDGRQNYWGNMQGTSMASPFAAGTFALWLEADPSLTVADVKNIATSTAIKDNYVTTTGSAVQWGAGKLDALAGLKEVLDRRSGIGAVIADDESSLIIRDLGSRQFNIFVAAAQSIDATLYSTSGAAVASLSAPTNDATLDASSVAPGVYILAVDAANSRLTRKIIIR